jgi:hypothetical protein
VPQSGAPAVPSAGAAAPTEVFSTPALSLPRESRDDKAPALERSTLKVEGHDILIQEPSGQTETGVELAPRPVSSPPAGHSGGIVRCAPVAFQSAANPGSSRAAPTNPETSGQSDVSSRAGRAGICQAGAAPSTGGQPGSSPAAPAKQISEKPDSSGAPKQADSVITPGRMQ